MLFFEEWTLGPWNMKQTPDMRSTPEGVRKQNTNNNNNNNNKQNPVFIETQYFNVFI